MSAAAEKLPLPASVEDLLALPDEGRGFEIIDSEIIEKQTSGEHSQTQASLVIRLGWPFGRRPGGGFPGGWWFATECLIDFGPGQQLRPDVAGWRRERMPQRPAGTVQTLCPDWACEIVSPTNETNDTIRKRHIYFRHGMPHYWLIDPIKGTLTVLRRTRESDVEVLSASRGQTVRAEPFESLPLQVGVLFGDDEE